MSRTLPTLIGTAVAASDGYETADLIELQFGSGTLRWTTASVDLTWSGQTWSAVGGALVVGDPQESTDERAAGVTLSFAAVDPSIMTVLLGQTYLGRRALVYRAAISQATGAIDAVLIFDGLMNDGFQVRDERDQVSGSGAITIETTLTARLGDVARVRGIRTNVESHQALFSGDTFFQFVPQLANKTIRWGRPVTLVPGRQPGGAFAGPRGKTLE